MFPRRLLAVSLAACCGCTSYAAYYERSADREVMTILNARRFEAVASIQDNAVQPKPAPEATPAGGQPDPRQVKVLSLSEAVQIATERNRSYQTQRETLYLSALSLTQQYRNFGPILSNTIEYVYSGGAATSDSGTGSATFGVSQILPTGGTLSASTSASATDNYEGGDTSYSHDVTVSFDQPLLKGAGREATYESLTQAQRNVLYALRDFELFRQDFVIDVLQRYYSILREKQVVKNRENTYKQFQFLRKRSDALFLVGKVKAIDKFRAAQNELEASNELIIAREILEALLEDFRVFLNLPPTARVQIEDTKPEVRAANIDLRSAIQAALNNRLDLHTSGQRLEDAERHVRVAKNSLLPDLDLAASWSLDGDKTSGTSREFNGSQSVGLALSLPLDKVPDRNAYKRSLIDLARRKRDHDLATDNVRVGVIDTYRRLRRLANSVRIQRANVDMAEKRVRNAQLRFEAGELGNRDVVEAEDAKLRAQNSLVSAILDYEIARLKLKRDIGILFIGPDGMWKE